MYRLMGNVFLDAVVGMDEMAVGISMSGVDSMVFDTKVFDNGMAAEVCRISLSF